MKKYELIAVDLDGTLVRSDQSISQRTLDALIRVQQQGVKVAVASGRPTFGTAHAADALRLDEFLCILQVLLGNAHILVRQQEVEEQADSTHSHLFSLGKE